jgi:fibronectin type 3 domain-containing protein
MRKTLHLQPAICKVRLLAFLSLLLLAGCGKLHNLYAQMGSDKPHSVTIRWTASVSRVAGYNVYRASPPTGRIKLTANIIHETQYVDKTVEVGRTYSYSVTSVDFKGGESVPSEIVTVTIPAEGAPPAHP